jgi:hypothetical protein
VGRKDSKTASFELAASNLPTADEGLLSIMTKFLYQGLSATDLVALSGRMLGSVIVGVNLLRTTTLKLIKPFQL